MSDVPEERQHELEEEERREEAALEDHRQQKARAQHLALAAVRALSPEAKIVLLGHLVTLFPETTMATLAKMAAGHE